MSLNVYFEPKDVPKDLKIVTENDMYFALCDGLVDTPEVRRILMEIDKAEYCDKTSVVCRRPGYYNGLRLRADELSTGCKTVLNVLLYSDTRNVCINPIEVGDSAWTEILLLNRGNVICPHCFILTDFDRECDIKLNGVLCKTLNEYSELESQYEHGI